MLSFLVLDGDNYLPQAIAQGPWGQTINGQVVGGLLARTIERDAGDPEFQPARLTVDLLRPVRMEALQVHTAVQREGRRIKVVDASLTQRGVVVARASAVLLRRGPQPAGRVWSPVTVMPPPPNDAGMPDPDRWFWSYGENAHDAPPGIGFEPWQQAHSQKFTWVRERSALIAGEAMTPFIRAALAGDVTSALTHWGTDGLRFINADYTLTLSRLPDGDLIGFAAMGHCSDDGVATGLATVFDHHGPIGHAVATALAQPPEAFTDPQLR